MLFLCYLMIMYVHIQVLHKLVYVSTSFIATIAFKNYKNRLNETPIPRIGKSNLLLRQEAIYIPCWLCLVFI